MLTLQGAIVGFGNIAQTAHVQALQSAKLHVVAVVETAEKQRVAAQHIYPDIRLYHDVATLLAQEKLDFIDICTPPHMHHDAARAAICAGVHVLCEKPLVLQYDHAVELYQLAIQHQVVVACMHNWTQAPILQRAWQLYQASHIGVLQSVEFVTLRTQPAAIAGDAANNWRVSKQHAGGGILFDHGWHGTSILLRSANAQAIRIRGQIATKRHTTLQVEDTCNTWVEFSNGVIGKFSATWAADTRRNQAWLRGTDGLISIDNDTLKLHKQDNIILEEVFEESLAQGGYRPNWTYGIIQEFKHEIQNPALRGRLFEEALTVLDILQATYASAQQNYAVIDLPQRLPGLSNIVD